MPLFSPVSAGGIGKATVTGTTGSPNIDSSTRAGKTIYKFTGSGTITIGTAGTCEVLVIGGGGGGCGDHGECGGRGDEGDHAGAGVSVLAEDVCDFGAGVCAGGGVWRVWVAIEGERDGWGEGGRGDRGGGGVGGRGEAGSAAGE